MEQSAKSRHLHRGLSIIELMIALGLGVIIMLGVTTVATQNSAIRNELERTGRQIESAIYAMDVIERDVANAAFWGERGEIGPDVQPPICISDPNEAERSMGYPIQGGRGDFSCDGSTISPKANSDYIAIRRVSSCEILDTECEAAGNNMHLQVHACFDLTSALKPGDDFKIVVGTSGLDYLKRDCLTAAPIYRFINHVYYIDDNDTLKRLAMGENGNYGSPESLVENVEMMRFEYGLDVNRDAQVDDLVSAGLADPNDPDWGDVAMVRVKLVVRNHQQTSGFTDDRTYSLGGLSYTPTDTAFRRKLYTRTISPRNIIGRRENP